jgi:cobalamin biosynthesis protein CobC
MPEHGGDPAELEKLYGRPEKGWLDLSTGINPCPYRARGLNPDDWGPLPTLKDITRLRQAAAKCYGALDEAFVVPAPGTQSLIQTLPRLRPTGRVCVLSPTYNEHAHCWRAAGHDVTEISRLSSDVENADVVIVVNPNNPDGRRHDPQNLKNLAARQAENGRWLVVDEAFCDVTPELSLASLAGAPGLIILRSFGKFYGLAGLRLGFALTETRLAEQLSTRLGPWSVSTPAIKVGVQALSDQHWIENTREELQKSSDRMDQLLSDIGMSIVGGTILFKLVESEDASSHFHWLAGDGILVRKFQHNPEWLRFGLPFKDNDWQRLEASLSAWAASQSQAELVSGR